MRVLARALHAHYAAQVAVVVNHDAAFDPPPAPPGGYDRVLCDVPCSGDGTMRKNGSTFRRTTSCFFLSFF